MQTNTRVRDTDWKEGNVMNNNPNRGKEKQMNAITRTTSVAVLVTLGLALTAWAAEPPKPQSRDKNDAAGAAERAGRPMSPALSSPPRASIRGCSSARATCRP
jgi:hypothetical protein